MSEAIQRLKTEHLIAPADSEPYPVEADYCIATSTGRALAQTFLDAWHFARHHALYALRNGDIHQMMQARSHLLKDLGFPRGTPLTQPRPGAWFEHLLKAAPTILSPLPSSTTEDLRGELALESLFGKEDSSQGEKEWGSAESVLVPFSRSYARDMFDIAATARFKLDSFRRIGVTHVTIASRYTIIFGVPLPPPPCETCQQQIGTVWSINAAPELPHPACTNALGCRCTFSMSRPPN